MNNTRTGPVRGVAPGIAAIDFEGSRYCLDCAAHVMDGHTIAGETEEGWETFEQVDGDEFVQKLVSGDVYTIGNGGVCFRNGGENSEQWYCDCSEACVNALSADEHSFDFDSPVGVLLEY